MKEFLLIFAIVACMFSPALAQQDAKLSAAFTEAELSDFSEKNPEKLAYLQFKANECYQVQDLSGKKDIGHLTNVLALNDMVKNHEVGLVDVSGFNKDQFNPLLYSTETEVHPAYYRIGETGAVLVIYSEQRCLELFKK